MSKLNDNSGFTFKDILNEEQLYLDSMTIDELTVLSTLDVTSATLVGIPNELHNLTSSEVNQLTNINNTAISATQWGYLGNMDQDVSSTATVNFATLSANNGQIDNLSIPGNLYVDDISEYTPNLGVTIDGVLIKNGLVDGVDVSTLGANNNQLISTALISGGELTVYSATEFKIAAGTGIHHNQSTGVITNVSWSDLITTDSYRTTDLLTYVLIDSAGAVVQLNTKPTQADKRDYIYIGVSVHVDLVTVSTTNPQQIFVESPLSQLNDLAESLGFINASGNIPYASGANLRFSKTAGTIFKMGCNYETTAKSPNIKSLGAFDSSSTSFQYRLQDGSNYDPSGPPYLIDPDYYDVFGTRTVLPANKWQCQRIYTFVSGLIKIQYGQVYYSNQAQCQQGFPFEAYSTEKTIADNGLLIGYLVVKQGATLLNDTSQAIFYPAGKLGSISGSTNANLTLQQTYDNSDTPEIVTDSTRGALSIKRGSEVDADNVLEILNGSDNITAAIKGDGTINTNDITAIDPGADTMTLTAYTIALDSPTPVLISQLRVFDLDTDTVSPRTVNGNLYIDENGGTGSIIIGSLAPVEFPAGLKVEEITAFSATDIYLSADPGRKIYLLNDTYVNTITSWSTNTNLTLSANGTGVVSVADGLTVTSGNTLSANTITSTTSNTDLSLSGSGTGAVKITDSLKVDSVTTTTGSGVVAFTNQIECDTISSNLNNTNLVLYGKGSGYVQVNDHLKSTGSVYTDQLEPYTSNTPLDIYTTGTSAYPNLINMPYVYLTRGSNQSIPNITYTVVQYTTTVTNSHSFSISSGTITIKFAGLYLLEAGINWASSTAGGRYMQFWINGATEYKRIIELGLGGNCQSLSGMYKFAVNDTVAVRVYQSTGGALNCGSISDVSMFQIMRISN